MKKNYFLKKFILSLLILNFVIIYFIPLSNSNIINQSTYGLLKESMGNDWWPSFHHDILHTGFSTANAPDNNQVLWTYQTNDLITSSPIVSHGKVYIGSWDHNLYCLDMDTGSLLWSYPTNGMISATPAIENNRVFLGSQDSYLYCLDATDGNLIWSYKTNYMIESSPTVKDDRVYFGSNDGFLYCLDTNAGDFIWKYSTKNAIWSSPVITDNYLYFGDLNGNLLCLEIQTGNLVWNYTIGGGIWSSPALDDNKIYFGGNDYNIYCLNAYTGSLIWNYTTFNEVHSSPAIAYGNIYIGSSDGRVICLEKETGAFVWSYEIPSGGVWASPAIADDKVYFGADSCCGFPSIFLCLDAHNGSKIWDYDFQNFIGIKSCPVIAAGKVFTDSGNGKIFAFGRVEFIADANGPYFDFVNDPINFKGSAYGGSPDYTWYWDFGDGNTSNLQNPTHIYDEIGQYDITLTVTDNDGSISTDETSVYIEIPNNPPYKPTIDGQTNGKIGKEYSYCIMGVDPDNDSVYVRWDWGDGNSTNWLGPYLSGNTICSSHVWGKKGMYTISAYLKDQHGETVNASLSVNMPRNKEIRSFLQLILEKFPLVYKIIKILPYDFI